MPKRRTPQELQAHHEALAAKHAFAARVAADPVLKTAIRLRSMIGTPTAAEQELAEALDAYIGEVPDGE